MADAHLLSAGPRPPRRARLSGSGIAFGAVAVLASVLCGAVVAALGDRLPLVAVVALPVALVGAGLVVRSHRVEALARRLTLDPVERLAVVALCGGLVCITWNGVRAGPGLAAADVLLFAAACLLAVRFATGHPIRLAVPPWLLIPAFVLLLDAFLPVMISGEPVSSLAPAVRLVVALALTPIVIGAVAGNFRAVWLAVDCWIFSVAVNAFVAVSDNFAHTDIGASITGVVALDRVAGLTTQPNHLALVTVMALPVIVSRVLTARVRALRVLYGGVAILAGLALLASGSRGGVVAGLVAIVTVPFFQASVRASATALVAVGAVIVVVLAPTLAGGASFAGIDRLTAPAQATGVSESDLARAARRRVAEAQIESSPVYGVGFTHVRDAHSIYLQLLAAGGVIALAAFLAYVAGAARSGWLLARRRLADREAASLAGALVASVAMWVLLGAVENQIFDRYLMVPFGLIVALMLTAADEERRPHPIGMGDAPSRDQQ